MGGGRLSSSAEGDVRCRAYIHSSPSEAEKKNHLPHSRVDVEQVGCCNLLADRRSLIDPKEPNRNISKDVRYDKKK